MMVRLLSLPSPCTSLHRAEACRGLNGEASVTCSISYLILSYPQTDLTSLGRTYFKIYLVIPSKQLLTR